MGGSSNRPPISVITHIAIVVGANLELVSNTRFLEICDKVDIIVRHHILIITLVFSSVFVDELQLFYSFILLPFLQRPILIFRLCIDM